jgi:ankyrin repeat protein
LNARDNLNQTPLDYAIHRGNQELIRYLTEFPSQRAQRRWKRAIPKSKKIVRNRVFLDQYFPPNVAKQISEQSVGFGRVKNKIKSEIKYLLKLKW